MATEKKEQNFTFETMAVVLYCMLESGVTLGSKHYKMMSAIDGTRGEAAFQHQFRKVKTRAKELQEGSGNGEAVTPVKKGRGKGITGTPKSSSKKRGKQAMAEEEGAASNGDDEDEAADPENSESESPSKRVKQEEFV